MRRPAASPLVVALMIAASVSVLIATFQANDNPVTRWVSTYQTLIGGIFAIFAAYVTVYQMRDSDFENDRRHRELMSLGLRADRLRLDRAFSRNHILRSQAGEVALPAAQLLGTDSLEEMHMKLMSFSTPCKEARDRLNTFRPALEAPAIVACMDLFDGEILNSYHRLQLATRALYGNLDTIAGAARHFDNKQALFRIGDWEARRQRVVQLLTDANAWEAAFQEFQIAAVSFFDQSDRLLRLYRTNGIAHG
jgi:hypothetical protein